MSLRTLSCCALLSLSMSLAEQQPRPTAPPPAVARFGVAADLVLVPFTVTDRRGAVIHGLPRDQFAVLEDGREQRVAFFAEEDEPVSFGIVFDRSGSMENLLPIAKESLRRLVGLASDGDEGGLVLVSSRPQVAAGLTTQLDTLLDRAIFTEARGGTALNDAIDRGIEMIRRARNSRRALVILSDGMDNHSRRSRGELMRKAEECGVQIYAVSAYDTAIAGRKPIERSEQDRGVVFLSELTARTGGFSRLVRGQDELRAAVTEIGRALQSRYVIGFAPGDGRPAGQWRCIRVKVSQPGLRAHARPGYRRHDPAEVILPEATNGTAADID